MQTGIPEITPEEVKKKMDLCEPFVLIDVREPHEHQTCRIPGSRLIPLGEVSARMGELDSTDEIVVHCKAGIRSAQAADLLIKAGFRKTRNLKGGILAWLNLVSPAVPRY